MEPCHLTTTIMMSGIYSRALTFSTGCTNCIFQVVALKPQQTSITNDGTCDAMFHPAAFGYTIDNEVAGYEGINVLMYSTGTGDPDGNVILNEDIPWFYNMTSTSWRRLPIKYSVLR